NFFPPGSGLPSIGSCIIPDNFSPFSLASGNDDCGNQVNLGLSKSRLSVPFAASADGLERARLVIALPTIQFTCSLNAAATDCNGVANPPFQCAAAGEKIAVTVSNQLGASRAPKTKRLSRSITVLAIGPKPDPLADVWINTGRFRSGT